MNVKKRINLMFSVVICAVILIASVNTTSFAKSEGATKGSGFKIFSEINTSLLQYHNENKNYMSTDLQKAVDNPENKGSIEIQFNPESLLNEENYNDFSAKATILAGDEQHTIDFKGELFYGKTDEGLSVLIGGLDGYVGNIRKHENIANISVHYALETSESFLILTIGNTDVGISEFFFGEGDNAHIFGSVIKKMMSSEKTDNYQKEDINNIGINSVDAEPRLKGTGYDSNNTAFVSVVYANELRNQSSMTVKAKANSHSNNMKTHLQGNSIPVHSIGPDHFEIETVSAADRLHSTGYASPTSGNTSYTIPIVFWWGGSLYNFNISVTTSTTSVSFLPNIHSSLFNNQIVRWKLGRSLTFSGTDYTTGNPATQSNGVSVETRYTYEGNVTTNRTETLGAISTVRYKYLKAPTGFINYVWSGAAVAGGNVTIVP